MKIFKKTLTLILIMLMVLSIGGNIKVVKAALPPVEYEINSNGEGVLVDYRGKEENVVLPETITLDGQTVPLTQVSEGAFDGCRDLTSIRFSKNIKYISSAAFNFNNKIKEFSVDEENNYFTTIDGALYSKDKKVIIRYPQAKDATIARVYSEATTVLPYAFSGCNKLEQIKIYDKITSIGKYAFEGCRSLKKFTIPEGVEEIEYGTFGYCENMEILNIPSTFKNLNRYMINACYGLKEINISKDSKYLTEENGCIYNINKDTLLVCVNTSNNEELIVPKSVNKVEDYAFVSCKNLKRVVLPEGIKRINNYTFMDCENLIEVNIPSTVEEIGSSAFSYCNSLEYLNIPDGVKKIENNLFYECPNLKSINIPNSVSEIGERLVAEDSSAQIVCNENSYARQYADENNISFRCKDELKIHYYNSKKWDKVNVYGYVESPEGGVRLLTSAWSGQSMVDEGNGWWSYDVPEETTGRFLFNNGFEQDPSQAIPGYECSGEAWIKNSKVIKNNPYNLGKVTVKYILDSPEYEEMADSITLVGEVGSEYTAPAESTLGIIGEYRLSQSYILHSNDEDIKDIINSNREGNYDIDLDDYNNYGIISDVFGDNEETVIYYIYDEAIGGNCWWFSDLETDEKSPQKLGETLNLKFNVIGGTPEETECRLSYRLNNGEWKIIKDYSYKENNQYLYEVEWKPSEIGDYTLRADVLGIDGHKQTNEIKFTIEDSKELSVQSFTSNKLSPQVKGSKITLTADATGEGILQYKFLIRDDKGNWYKLRDFSELNSYEWTAGVSGNKTLFVDVKDESENVVRKELKYTIYNDSNLLINSFTADKISPQESGNKITLTAQGTGLGILQYKFLIKDEKGNWYKLRDFSTSNSCQWVSGPKGSKTLYVDLKDETGNVTRRQMTYLIK